MAKREKFATRFGRVSRKLVLHYERLEEAAEKRRAQKQATESDRKWKTRPMTRTRTPKLESIERRKRRIIAYDLETTSIREGTPQPLYLTACGEGLWFSGRIKSVKHLAELLESRFLVPEFSGARFVAWNGNKFDVYFIALALLKSPEYLLRPYVTQTKNLRGLRVIRRQFMGGVEVTNEKGVPQLSWEFLDGMAMLGIQKPLKDFLKVFAPEYGKLDAPDFEHENFDPDNPAHVKYAERDSEGLYIAMEKARGIVMEHFQIDLCPTIGNMGIKLLMRHIPMGKQIWKPPVPALRVIRNYVMRGGFCCLTERYRGPIVKLDLNQCYAAAMRDARLPAGRCMHMPSGVHPYAEVYIARIRAHHPRNRIPFYYRDIQTGKSVFGSGNIDETWLTSIEIEQLQKEGWKIEFLESWFWSDKFRLKEYVDKLEFLRVGEGRDPKDAQGEMCKAIGNNSYGKTVERLEGVELVLAAEQPEGFAPYRMDDEELEDMACVWFKFGRPMQKEYHQPQIGAFITAHARMVLRRAILLAPERWLYADTDCVVFKGHDIPPGLEIDPRKYGAWKLEDEGNEYIFASKKVYCSVDMRTKHAKGLNIRKLTLLDFENWLQGKPPSQKQLQRQNFIKVLAGAPMFAERVKIGEDMENTKRRMRA